MNARDPISEDMAHRDNNSLGNLLLRFGIITRPQLERALEDTALARELGDLNFRLGDALVRMGVGREVIELVARKQLAERSRESTTHITTQMASSNIAHTAKAVEVAREAIALATPRRRGTG